MATITENLKKILSAVYGKDVRQAIHDSIEQCHQEVIDAYSVVNDIVSKLSIPVKYDVVSGKVWHMLTMGDPGQIEEMTANEYCECTRISVNPGETYYIQVYFDAYGGGAYEISDRVMFAYEKNAGSGILYKHPESNYSEPNYSGEWMVTAPECGNPMYLLVYSTGVNFGGITKIRKMRV